MTIFLKVLIGILLASACMGVIIGLYNRWYNYRHRVSRAKAIREFEKYLEREYEAIRGK